jgi:apolipoprotein N-acyltransferase
LKGVREPLAPARRIGLLALGYAIYVLCAPGVVLPQGSPLGAFGVVFWALATSRPGPKAFRIEWLAGTIGFGSLISWMGYVFLPVLPLVVAGYGVYAAYGGSLMKRLAARLPLSIAVPLAWVGFESLLAWVPPPAGLSWLRLGHFLNDWPQLAGSGRVFGVTGLSFALAALAGLIAEWWVRRERPRSSSLVFGFGPAALALLLGLFVSVPESEPGPRLLLIQPAFEQERKQRTGTPDELFLDSIALTRRGLEEIERAGGSPPDLVCWGETMLPYYLAGEGLFEATEGELSVDPWNIFAGLEPDELRGAVAGLVGMERKVLSFLVGGGRHPGEVDRPRLLPEGAGFLSGAVLFVAVDGRLRRTNNVILWDDQGNRSGVGGKQHLAPGGETMVGLESFSLVREVIFDLAGYVPDFLAAKETGVLELSGGGGERWSFGVTTCFDNAFPDVYAQPLREGPLDFHLVVSNEAWYRNSQELDQMVAFSKLLALCTGRSVVRATNGGVSLLIGPDGSERNRLVVGGEDREVRGTLAVQVPVPVAESRAITTPFVHLEPWLLPLGSLLPLLILLLRGGSRFFGGSRRVTREAPEASESRSEGDVRTLDRP